MKKMFLLAIFGIFSFFGCSSVLNEDCPYLIANKNFEIGNDGSFDFAGVNFTFYNGAKKDVKSFTLSFMLYDSDGNNPFVGSNNVIESFDESVLSETSQDFSLSLDKYLSVVPNEPYKIDFMYVKRIVYTDGTEWSDPFGMYSSREAVE